MQDKLIQFEELAIGSRLKRLSDHFMKEAAKIYVSLSIDFDPYHMPIFKLIAEQDELTIGEISTLLRVTQPAVTQYINRLEKKRLIISKTGKIDKRQKKVSLSNEGEIMYTNLHPIWKLIDQEIKVLTHNPNNKTLLDHVYFIESELDKQSFEDKVLSKLTIYDEK